MCTPSSRDSHIAAHTAPRVEVAWTPDLRRLEREYDEAKHAVNAAHDGFEEGLVQAAEEAWERFSAAVKAERLRLLREREGSWGEPYEKAMLDA